MSTEELLLSSTQASPQEIHSYQMKVGYLNYAAMVTRPDIARATQKLAEFLTNPGPEHHDAANRVIAYLRSTKTLAIESGPTLSGSLFEVSSDASFADNSPDR